MTKKLNPFEAYAATFEGSFSFPENIKNAIVALQNYVGYLTDELDDTAPPGLKKHIDQVLNVIAVLKGWEIDGDETPDDVAKLWPQWISRLKH